MHKLFKALLAGIVALGLYLPPAGAGERGLTPAQRADVEKVIRDYLLAHPELLVEVMHELDQRRKASAEMDSQQRLVENRAAIFESKYDHVENPDGKIPVVEFFDYQCGYCKRLYPDLLRVRRQEGDVRVIFKEFPILGPASTYAARVAIAARRQGKYMAFHDAMMQHRGHLDEATVMHTAESVGLKLDRLKVDMKDPEVQQIIDANHELAQRMDIRGTPTMFIGDKLVPGAIAYRQMQSLIEEMRKDCTVC